MPVRGRCAGQINDNHCNMKKILCATLAVLTLTTLSLYARKDKAPAGITVMSYNVRLSSGNDGSNSWQYRYPASAMMIDDQKPDLLGMQEARPDQVEYFKEVQSGYKQVGVGRDDGKHKGEHMLVLYNTATIKLLKWGTFWLSETPDKPSKGWDAACFRTATWTLVKDKRSGKKFYFIDTHLDHKGTEARRLGIQVIIDKIAEINKQGLPIVLVGDFNMEYDHPSMAPAREQLQDARRTAMKSDDHFTFNGWGRSRDSIDFIWYSGFSSCPEYETVTKPYMDRTYISDHFPGKAKLLF